MRDLPLEAVSDAHPHGFPARCYRVPLVQQGGVVHGMPNVTSVGMFPKSQGTQSLLKSGKLPLIIFEFCDWAEARVSDGKVGDAQQLLLDAGFSIWRLEDLTKGRTPLNEPITTGYIMLVAQKQER